jgi:hypothetical protein
MSEPLTWLAMASFALLGLTMLLFAGLKGWQGWLELRRLELTGTQTQPRVGDMAERIELADLKERIRKLESLASCIDL